MKTNPKMKTQDFKTIVVRLMPTKESAQFEFEVDTDIFDDPFLEASTRAVEAIKDKKGSTLRALMTCWEKKSPKKVYMYNTYWILVNAGLYAKAELIREKFKIQSDIDLKNEPVKTSLSSKKD